jgi:FkbM family methyltransferase
VQPIVANLLLDSLREDLTRSRKEALCRQQIGYAIARYFIKHERTPDLAIPFEQVTIDSNPVWVPDMLERKALSEPEFAVFRYFDDPTDTILDIGAHFGYSAASIWTAGSRAMVVSFEPNPWHIACLERIKAMRPTQFDYLTTGLGSTTGEVGFTMPVVEGTGISGLSSAAIESETDWAIPENILLYMMNDLAAVPMPRLQFSEARWPVARLDDVLSQHPITVSLTHISAIKIDAEGFEADVIAGAIATLDHHRPMVMIEGANRVPEVLAQLTARRYVYADFHGDGLVLSDKRSARTSGFYLHEMKLDTYRRIGLLSN